MSKAVIFFAPGLEECEGLLCVDILRRAGVEVTIAAVGGEKIVKSARQISVVADALAEELDYTVFDACILPGGIPGVPNLKADATVRRVCRDFAAEGKVVAAICAAPTALAAFGVLNGKKATVYPGMDADLTAAGASYTGLPLTIDGSIVTGAGACPHPGRCRRRQQSQERDRVSVIYRDCRGRRPRRPAGACGYREAPAGGQCPPLQPYNKTPCLFQDRALLF